MAEDLSSIFNNVKNMVDSGNIPEELKEMLNNFNKDKSSPAPESSSLPDLSSLLNSSNNKSNNTESENSNNFNIDINTILKMKSIIEAINTKDDPRANLLYSLKPYLRESRKSKLDQYVNLLNMTKIAEIMKNEKKEDDKNA